MPAASFRVNAIFVQLLLLLLVHEASATMPPQTTLPTPAEAVGSFAYPDPDNLLSQFCQICAHPWQYCACPSWNLQPTVQQSVLALQQASQTTATPYYVRPREYGNATGSGTTASAIASSSDHQNVVIRPEDLLHHPEWPTGSEEGAMEGVEVPGYAGGCLITENIDSLEDDATSVHSGIRQWTRAIYNAGDRLSPPQPSPSPRRRQAARPHGFPCDNSDCSDVFDRECDLRRHKKKHVRKSDRPHKCSQCDEAFTYPKDRDRHERTHNPQEQTQKIMCPVAGCKSAKTGFGRKDNYLRHIRDKHSIDSSNTQSS